MGAFASEHPPAVRAAVRPVPPAPSSKPGVCRCSPERESEHRAAAAWFREWCARNRISVRDLAAILDIRMSVAAKKLDGRSPVNTTDIRRFPARFRNDLILAYSIWCASSDAVALHA